MKNSNVRNVKSKVILLIIMLILILILIENLAFTQAESQQLLLLFVEKPYYEVGEKVTLIITADPLSDYELSINSESQNYKFSGELTSSIDFVPNEQGNHTAELTDKLTHTLADSLEFMVGAPQENQSQETTETIPSTPAETTSTSLISTDKKTYTVGETVQVQVSVNDTKEYKLYYEYQGMEQRYMGDFSNFSFNPVGIGTHYLILKTKTNTEIERYSFEIVAGPEDQLPQVTQQQPGSKKPEKAKKGPDWKKECFEDDTCKATYSFGRKHYFENNEWKDIDTKFEQGVAVDEWKAEKNIFKTNVNKNKVKITGEQNSEVEFDVGSDSAPVANDNVITYDLSRTLSQDGTDYSINATLNLTLYEDRIEKMIVIHDFFWPTDFDYNETLKTDLANGKFVIGDLSIWDSNGSVYPASWEYEGDEIKLSINKTWLDNAVYPIYIDPTVYYNYSDSSNNKAYKLGSTDFQDGATVSWANGWTADLVEASSDYTALSSSFGSLATSPSGGAGRDAVWRFEFTVNEDTALMNWMYFRFYGYEDSNGETGRCYVANFSGSGTWDYIGDVTKDSLANITVNYTSDFDDLINASDKKSAIYCFGDDFDTGGGVENVHTEFVEIITDYSSDTTAPTVNINLSWDDSITTDTTPGINFNFSDDRSSTANCTLYFNDTAYGTTNDISNFTDTTMTANDTIVTGRYDVWINCTDNYDNVGKSTVLNVSVDGGPVFNTQNATPRYVKNNTVVNISANVSAGLVAVDKVIARIYNSSGDGIANYTMANAGGDLYWNASYTVDFGSPGLYNVTIFANETNGVGGTSSVINFTPILNLTNKTDIVIGTDFSDWADIPVVDDAEGDSGGGTGTIDNELLITSLNSDNSNITIYDFNRTGSGQLEVVWTDQNASVDNIVQGAPMGDLNGDSVNDFVLIRRVDGSTKFQVWSYNASTGTWYSMFLDSSTSFANGGLADAGIADFDNDNFNELLIQDGNGASGPIDEGVYIYYNDTVGATSFSWNTTIFEADTCDWMPGAGDMNFNGIPEILVQCNGLPVQIYEWSTANKQYEWQGNVSPLLGLTPTQIDDMDCGDIDNDQEGDECVVCGNTYRSAVIDYVDGGYSVVYNSSSAQDQLVQSCAVGNITNEGGMDWFDTSKTDGIRVFTYRNGAYISLWNDSTEFSGNSPARLDSSVAGDVDNDGFVEFLSGLNSDLNTLKMWENDTVNASSWEVTRTWSNYFGGPLIVGDLDTNGSTTGYDPNFDIINYSLANNETYLFARIAVNGSIDYSDATKYYMVYLSTNDPSTGSQTSFGGATLPFKYDYRIQVNGTNYCGVFNSSNVSVASCDSDNNSNTIELRANLSQINMTNKTIVNITFETGTAGTVYDTAPDYNSFITYGSEGGEPAGNNPPTLDNYDTYPDSAYTANDLKFNITCSDTDGGDTITGYVEIFNGTKSFKNASSVVTSGTEATLWTVGNGNTSKGENWNATYWCGDATVNTSKSYDNVTILNSVPSNPSSLNINNVNVSDTLTGSCGGSSDADNDAITYHYYFYNVNDTGELQGWSDDVDYVIQLTDAHDQINVTCIATTADANSTGNYINFTTVDDSHPTNPSSLSLNEVNVSATLTGSCGGSSDADNDAITYHYYFYNVNDTGELQGWSDDVDYVIQLTDAHDDINVTCKATTIYANSSGNYTNKTTVDDSHPTLPTLDVPDDNNITWDNTTYFNWTDSSDADNDGITYGIEIDGDSGFGSIDQSDYEVASNEYTATELADGVWYWHVKAITTYTNSSYASYRTLTIDTTPPSVSPTSPDDNLWTTDTTPDFVFTVTDSIATDLNCSLWVDGSREDINESTNNNTQTTFAGVPLSEAAHTWTVNCTDNASNEGATTARTLNIDNTAPTVNINISWNNTVFIIDQPTLNFNFTDSVSSTANCTLFFDSTSVNSTVNTANKTWTDMAVNTSMSDNNYSVYVNCTDKAGKIGKSGVLNIEIDTSAPVVSEVANDSITYNSARINWTTDEEANGSVDYGETTALGEGPTTDSGFSINHSISLSGLSATTFYYYNITTCDAQGWCNISGLYNFSTTAETDTEAPTVYINTSLDGTFTNNTQPTIDFNFTDDKSITANCTLYFDDVAVNNTLNTDNNSQTDMYVNTSQSLGNYTVFINCSDATGNKGKSSEIWMIIDNQEPVVSPSSPDDNSWTTDTTPDFSFTALDNYSQRMNCILYVDDSNEDSNASTLNNTATTLTATGGLSEAAHTWTVNCTDNASNEGATTERTLNIDNTAPTVNINISWNNTEFVSSKPTINFNFTDSVSSTANCTLYFNDTGYNYTTDINNKTWTDMAVNTSLNNGRYDVYINCTDKAGKLGKSGVLNISINVPTLEVNVTADATTYLAGSTVNASGTFYWSNGTKISGKNVTVKFYNTTDDLIDEKNITTTASGTYWSNYTLLSTDENGTWTINITGIWNSTNSTFNTTTFTVNKTLTILNPAAGTDVDRDDNNTDEPDNATLVARLNSGTAGVNVFFIANLTDPVMASEVNIGLGNGSTNSSGEISIIWNGTDNTSSKMYAGNYTWWIAATDYQVAATRDIQLYGSLNLTFRYSNQDPNTTYDQGDTVIIDAILESLGPETRTQLNSTYLGDVNTTLTDPNEADTTLDLIDPGMDEPPRRVYRSYYDEKENTIIEEVIEEPTYSSEKSNIFKTLVQKLFGIKLETQTASLYTPVQAAPPTNKSDVDAIRPSNSYKLEETPTLEFYFEEPPQQEQPEEKPEIELVKNNEVIKSDVEITNTEDNILSLKVNKPNEFNPGVYSLKVSYNGITQEEAFLWGVLAINTHKSIYLPNEEAFIGMAVLDNEGRMVCDADVILDITDPAGKTTTLSTIDNTIKISPECQVYGVTDLPDYYANYNTLNTGTYTMTLTAITSNGARSLEQTFEVQSYVPFDVERNSATRIFPFVPYTMNFTIKANQNYQGSIVEYVPANFEITPQQGLTITTIEDTKLLTWNKDLIAGETYTLSYEFDAPDITPYLFTLGPLEIGSWHEIRQWLIASDKNQFLDNSNDGNDTTIEEGDGLLVSTYYGEAYKGDIYHIQLNHSSTKITNNGCGGGEKFNIISVDTSSCATGADSCTWDAANDYVVLDTAVATTQSNLYIYWYLQACTGSAGSYTFICSQGAGSTDEVVCDNPSASSVVVSEPVADSAAPRINLLDPANGNWSNTQTPFFNFSVEDETASTLSCVLWINGTGYNSSASVANNTEWMFVANASIPENTNYNWSINCSDGTNSNLSVGRNINIDVSAPTVTLLDPADNNITNDQTPFFNFSVTDTLDDTFKCVLWINGTGYNSSASVANNTETMFVANASIPENSNYNWSVNCSDTAGNVDKSDGRYIDIDTTAPTVTPLDPADYNWTNDQTPFFNFSYTDSINATAKCELWINGTSYNSSNSVANNTETMFVANAPIPENSNYNWTVRCEDNFKTGTTTRRTISIDKTAPVVNAESPGDNLWTTDTTPDFVFNVTDTLASDLNCSLWVDGSREDVNESTNNNTQTTFAGVPLSEAAHTWTVNCTDNASNKNYTTERTLNIDNTVPVIGINESWENTFTSNTQPVIQFMFNDSMSTTANCTLYFDDVAVNSTINSDNKTWTNMYVNTSQSAGNYTVYTNCTDKAGKIGKSTPTWIIIDNVAPSLQIESPADYNWTQTDTPDFVFTVTDTLDPDLNCSLFVDGSSEDNNASTLNDTSTTLTSSALSEGSHLWTINCSDSAGNKDQSTPRNITIDSNSPVVASSSPDDNDWTTDTTPDFIFAVNDSIDYLLNCSLFVDGSSEANNVSTMNNTQTTFAGVSLSESTHSWVINCSDNASNNGNSGAKTINIDNTAPTVNINTSWNNTVFTTDTPTLNFNFTDSVSSTANCTLFFDSTSVNSTVNTANKTWTDMAVNTSMSDNNYSVYVNCTDEAGKIGKSGVLNIEIDTSAPVVSGVVNWSITSNSAKVNWTTDEEANGSVKYGTTLALSTGEQTHSTYLTKHNLSLSSLDQSQFYYYNITTCDTQALCNISGPYNFTTLSGPDETPPTVNINASLDGTFTSDTTPVVNFNFTDSRSGTANCTLYFDGVAVNSTLDTNNKTWTDMLVNTSQSVGNYTVFVNCTDNASNEGKSSEIWMIIDNVAPSISPSTPDDNAWTSDTTPDFVFTATDIFSQRISCVLYVDDSNKGSNSSTLNNTQTTITSIGLAETSHSWIVNCTDNASNEGTMVARTVYIDNTAPTVNPESPADYLWTTDTTPDFVFNVSDSMASDLNCSLWVDGSREDINESTNNNTQTTFAGVSLSEASYTWTINCTDNASKTGYTTARTLNIDNTAPAVNINTSLNNTEIISATPTINFNFTDSVSSTANCTLYINNTAYNHTTGIYNVSDTDMTSNTTLPEGRYDVYINCTDNAGKINKSDVLNITINAGYVVTNLPTGTIFKLESDTTKNVAEYGQNNNISVLVGVDSGIYAGLIVFDFTDDIDVSKLVIKINQTTKKSVIHNSSELGSAIVNVSLLVPLVEGTGSVYICPNAESLEQVNSSCPGVLTISTGQTSNGMTVSEVSYDSVDYYLVENITGTGGGESETKHWNNTFSTGGETTGVWNVSINADANWFYPTWVNDTRQFTLSAAGGNNDPTIDTVSSVAAQTPNPEAVKSVLINFTVSDIDGTTDLNHSSAKVTVNQSGVTRTGTCSNNTIDSDTEEYNCTVNLQHYDLPGTWSINVSIKDNSEASAYNATTVFSYNELLYIQVSPVVFGFGDFYSGQQDQAATSNPLQIDNLGNVNLTQINITAFNLVNESNFIDVSNITVNVSDSASGTALQNNSNVTIPVANVSMDTVGGETNASLYFYIDVPNVRPLYYESSSSWVISAGN